MTIWMVYVLVTSIALAAAASLLERLAGDRELPRRWGWIVGMLGAVVLAVAVPLRAPTAADGTPSATEAEPAAAAIASVGAGDAPLPAGGPSATSPEARAASAPLSGADMLLTTCWLASTLLLLAGCVIAVLVLWRRRRHWREDRVDGVPVLVSRRDGPALFGLFRPRIVLPQWTTGLEPEIRQWMLRHEEEHRRARDPLLIHLGTLLLVLMPWNVALWWMARRLRFAIELDCDARVLRGDPTADPAGYGALLLAVAGRRAFGLPLMTPALLEHPSFLHRRIAAMSPFASRLGPVRRIAAGAALLVAASVALLLPAPSLSAQQRSALVERLIGTSAASPMPDTSLRAERGLMTKYFPDVLRGEGPANVVFLRDREGKVTGTTSFRQVERALGRTAVVTIRRGPGEAEIIADSMVLRLPPPAEPELRRHIRLQADSITLELEPGMNRMVGDLQRELTLRLSMTDSVRRDLVEHIMSDSARRAWRQMAHELSASALQLRDSLLSDTTIVIELNRLRSDSTLRQLRQGVESMVVRLRMSDSARAGRDQELHSRMRKLQFHLDSTQHRIVVADSVLLLDHGRARELRIEAMRVLQDSQRRLVDSLRRGRRPPEPPRPMPPPVEMRQFTPPPGAPRRSPEPARPRPPRVNLERFAPPTDSTILSLDRIRRRAGELGPEPVSIYYLTRKK